MSGLQFIYILYINYSIQFDEKAPISWWYVICGIQQHTLPLRPIVFLAEISVEQNKCGSTLFSNIYTAKTATSTHDDNETEIKSKPTLEPYSP